MPLLPTDNPDLPRPPSLPDPTAMDGQIYFYIVMIIIAFVAVMVVFWLVIKIWGNPIMVAKSSRRSGEAIIQHLENSKIGQLKLASLGGGALRFKNVEDGTLITLPKGINTLHGHSIVNSWHLTGISVPIFLIGAITKARLLGFRNKNELEEIEETKRNSNLIGESYDFDNFEDILWKSKNPQRIPLEIEHINDFITSVNQHYTESRIMKGIDSDLMNMADPFGRTIFFASISIFIVAIADYVLIGAIK